MTNDLVPHPANAMTARQIAKRKNTVRSPFFDVGSSVWSADPGEQPAAVANCPGLNRQQRKVHQFGTIAISRRRRAKRPALGGPLVCGGRYLTRLVSYCI
jgi:hypothetical protein